MKKEDLFEGISGLDEDILLRSEETPRTTNKWIKSFVRIASAAACLAVLFLAYDLLPDNRGDDGVGVLTPVPMANESCSVEETESIGSEASVVGTTDESREDSTSAAEKQKEVNLQNAADLGCLKGQAEEPTKEAKTMISGYQGVAKPQTEGLRKIENAAVYYSEGLQAALQEYQDTVNYRVVVKVYKNSYEIAANSSEVNSEMERLGAAGYIVAYETYNDGIDETYLFTVHATYEQLKNYAVSEQYGYYILLYDQVVKAFSETSYVYPEVNNQYDYTLLDKEVAADEFGEYREATPYPDDILELQKRVSADMSAGNLPFVISSSIMENPLRLEIRVITQDNDLINQVKAYDPEGKYIRVLQATKEAATEDLATYKE